MSVLAGVLVANAIGAEATPAQQTCSAAHWTAPAFAAEDSHVVAMSPSLAMAGGHTYVVGNAIARAVVANPVSGYTPDTVPLPSPAFSAFELNGALLGRPDGAHTFAYPKVLGTSSGRLDLLWADADGPLRPLARLEWPGGPLTSIWNASYEPGHGWSSPRLLYAATSVDWQGASVSSSQHAVITAARTLDQDGRNVLLRPDSRGEWTALELPDAVSGPYPNLAERGRELFLTFVAAAPGTRHDENSVFLAHSPDEGITWATRLVSRSGSHGAHTPVVVLGGGHDIDLVWFQERAREGSPEVSSWGGRVLRHVGSHDDGQTWSAPVDLDPPSTLTAIRAFYDICGTLNVVVQAWGDALDDPHLAHTTWRGAWSPLVDFFPSYQAMGPELRVNHDGQPVMVFVARGRRETPDVRLRTYQSTLVYPRE